MTKKQKVIIGIVLVLVIGGLSIYTISLNLAPAQSLQEGINAFDGGDYTSAENSFEKTLTYGSNAAADYYLGLIALGKPDQKGDQLFPNADYTKASSYFERAIAEKIDTNKYPKVYHYLGISYYYTCLLYTSPSPRDS